MSFLRKTYYQFKPFLPVSFRMLLRKQLAARRLAQSRDIWPIDQSAAVQPPGFPGWPGKKKFAFVLTHDVESSKGVPRCLPIAELEAGLGFRSSFNFIPEGTYQTPSDLREELMRSGFEVGVHDLKHDGKLYISHSVFKSHAPRINQYLKEWGAAGFRSGFMHHNLEWLHELDISYDMSTFDTDPFEPQPDGVKTIFPFWVSRTGRSGYAELPYTLPQDSTLFFLLDQNSPEIWKRKLDWVAEKGGMALVNVHPDYISLNGKTDRLEYPQMLYSEFLTYAAEKYSGEFWPALPRDVAAFVRSFSVRQSAPLEMRS